MFKHMSVSCIECITTWAECITPWAFIASLLILHRLNVYLCIINLNLNLNTMFPSKCRFMSDSSKIRSLIVRSDVTVRRAT